MSSEKPLVFVLDAWKQEEETGEEGKKRKKKSKQNQKTKDKNACTLNSFGSVLKISQFKGNPKFIIGFRARQGLTHAKSYTWCAWLSVAPLFEINGP